MRANSAAYNIAIIVLIVICFSSAGRTTPRSCFDNLNVQYNEVMTTCRDLNTEIHIQLVFHIIVSPSSSLTIMEEDVMKKVEELENHFSAEDVDLNLVPAPFHNAISRKKINFCVAMRSTSTKSEIGIVRKASSTDMNEFGDDIFADATGGSDPWDSRYYVNVWVLPFGNAPNLAGYTFAVGNSVSESEGIILNENFFHSKTLTHELGHYFGLSHLSSSTGFTSCDEDDGIEDTPNQSTEYDFCPPEGVSTCGSEDMYMNFMSLADDDCLSFFTKGQVDSMSRFIEINIPSLMKFNNKNCFLSEGLSHSYPSIEIYPNPTYSPTINIKFKNSDYRRRYEIEVINLTGESLLSDIITASANKTIHIPMLATPGVYYLRVGKSTFRIIYADQ